MSRVLCIIWSSFALITFFPSTTDSQFQPSPGRIAPPGRPSRPQTHSSQDGVEHRGLCRDGWDQGAITDFSGKNIPICIRINHARQSWADARVACRRDNGFMMKLDSVANIAGNDLMSIILNEGVTKFWTGMHTAYDHLAWDDLVPNQVQPINNNSISSRPWRWNDDDLGRMSQYCGSLTLDNDEDRKKRKKRAPDEHPDPDQSSSTSTFSRQFGAAGTSGRTFPQAGAFQSMLTRTQISDQIAEIPGATLGIQSERQLPGIGHTGTNIQHGGLMRTVAPMFHGRTTVPDSDTDSHSKSDSPSSAADLITSIKEQADKLHNTADVPSQQQTQTDMLEKWRDQYTEQVNTQSSDTQSKDQEFLSALHELYNAEQAQTPTTQSTSELLENQQSQYPTTQRNPNDNPNAYLDMVKSIQSGLSNIHPTNGPTSPVFSNIQPTQSSIQHPFSGTFNGQHVSNVNSNNGGLFNSALINPNPSDTPEMISDTVDNIRDALKDSQSSISDTVSTFEDASRDIPFAVSDVADASNDKLEPAVDTPESISDILDTIKDTQTEVHRLISPFSANVHNPNIPPTFVPSFADVNGDSVSASDMIENIRDTLTENAHVTNDVISDSGILSTSDLMNSVKDTVSKIQTGLSGEANDNTNGGFWNNESPLETSFTGLTSGTPEVISDAVDKIKDKLDKAKDKMKDSIDDTSDTAGTPGDLAQTFNYYMARFPTPAEVAGTIHDSSSSNDDSDTISGPQSPVHAVGAVDSGIKHISEAEPDSSSSLEHMGISSITEVMPGVDDDIADTLNGSPLLDYIDNDGGNNQETFSNSMSSDTLGRVTNDQAGDQNDDSMSEKTSEIISDFHPAIESSDITETLTDYLKHVSDDTEIPNDVVSHDADATETLLDKSDEGFDDIADMNDKLQDQTLDGSLMGTMDADIDTADNLDDTLSEMISDVSESNTAIEAPELDDIVPEDVLTHIDSDIKENEAGANTGANGDFEHDDIDSTDGIHGNVDDHVQDKDTPFDDSKEKKDKLLPFGVELPGEQDGDAHDDVIDDPPDMAEAVSPDDKVTALVVKNKMMDLSSCHAKLPSVCFSYQIEAMNTASTCANGWYGHVLLDRCYLIMDKKQSYQRSVAQCRVLGAELVEAQTIFERMFMLVAVQKDGKLFRGTKFWMSSAPGSNACSYFDEKEINVAQTCNRAMNAICVRPAKPLEIYTTDGLPFPDGAGGGIPETRGFYIRGGDNRLPCGLVSTAPELPTLWYKDGTLIQTKDRFVSADTSLSIDAALADAVQAVTNRDVTLPALQGVYWCEVWDRATLTTKRAPAFNVRFLDVMTFHGSVALQEFDRRDEVLFNMMDKKFESLSRTEMDLKTIFRDALPVIRAITPYVLDTYTYIDSVRSSPSVVEYHIYLTLSRNYTMAEEAATFTRVKGLLRAALRNRAYMAGLPGGTPVAVFRTMSLQSTVSCPEAELQTTQGAGGSSIPAVTFTFPRVLLGQAANSNETCSAIHPLPAGSARCLGGFETGAYWGEVVAHDCVDPMMVEVDYMNTRVWGTSPLTEKLTEMAQMPVDTTNVENVMTEVAQLTWMAESFTPTDINKIADVFEHTTQVDTLSKKVGEDMVKTVDRLMTVGENEVQVANKETHAANRIIKSLERFADHVNMAQTDHMRVVSDNVVMEIWDLKPESMPVIGLAAQSDRQKPEKPFRTEDIATIFNRSQLFQANVDAAIELPAEVFNMDVKGQKAGNRLTMMVFRKSKLFEAAAHTADDRTIELNNQQFSRLNSYVISASLAGKKLTGLKEKVKTIFRPLTINEKRRQCVFWDFAINSGRGGWSTEGCYYDGRTEGRDVCLCDHLTNFAVLLDFYGESNPISAHHELSLSIITVVGLSLSILGLSLTIITYAFFRKLRKGRAQQTLFNLAVALLCSSLVFLTGVRQTHHYWGCLVVALLLHYFILAAFMWMLMEAVLQYLTFVKILGTYITRFTLKTMLPAWGLPLVPVIAILSYDYQLYRGRTDYCWMDLQAFYYAFVIPVSCIIATNIVIFFITVVSIFRRGKGLRSNQKKQKMAMTNLQAALTSFILLGLTWVFGYLAISDARLPLQYIFTIFSSMQGFFIFALFVVRKKKVREQWYFVCCKGGEKDRVSRSLSATNSIPSTYSNGSNRNSRHDRDRSDSTKTMVSVSSKLSSRYSGGYTNHGYNSDYDLPYNRRIHRLF